MRAAARPTCALLPGHENFAQAFSCKPPRFSERWRGAGRNHIGVRRSSDDTATWSGKHLIEAGNSAGYSCLVNAPVQGRGGILFESLGAGNIAFATFPLSF